MCDWTLIQTMTRSGLKVPMKLKAHDILRFVMLRDLGNEKETIPMHGTVAALSPVLHLQ
jgi:hypothetical protein